MRSHLGESRAQVEIESVGEQKLTVRSVITRCALALLTSILEALDLVVILARRRPKEARRHQERLRPSLISAERARHALVYVGYWRRKLRGQVVKSS